MISSRLISYKWGNNQVLVIAARLVQHDSHQSDIIKETKDPAKLGNPNLIQRIILRFQGIPLKGEPEPPKAILDNLGKKFYAELPKVTKDYKEFPERDLVNFPYPEKLAFPTKTRFMLIPDHWLREVEKITGTSGPYVALAVIALFCLNKEWFAWNRHGIWLVYSFIPLYLMAKHFFAYKLDNFCYGLHKKKQAERNDYIQSELKDAIEFRKISKEQLESLKAAQENFPTIFRENLSLQLEAAYRANVDKAWSELKRRLDYLQEVQETKERFAKEILLKSITEGVRKQIETNEGNIREKYMDQCIDQLKSLAK